MKPQATVIDRQPIALSLFGSTRRSTLLLIVSAVALLTLSAKVQIPWWPVPMTMQTYVVLVIAMGYGTRLGFLSIGSYIVLGAMGLPLFAGTPEKGLGLPYIAGPTGGYLAGFLVAAAVCGALAARGWDRRLGTCIAAMTIGHVLILGCGAAWLATLIGWGRAMDLGVTPFILATVLKTVLAAISLPGVWTLSGRTKDVRPAEHHK